MADPVVDYLQALIDLINREKHLTLQLPPNFATYPEEDQRILLDNFFKVAHHNLTSTEFMAEIGHHGDIVLFLSGGSRPPITD
jgi:hypothetical protein